MNIGWIGKKEINLALKNKEFEVSRRRTKAKCISVYIDEKLGITEDEVMKLAKVTGLAEKLGLSDMNMLMAFCKSVVLTDRGHSV